MMSTRERSYQELQRQRVRAVYWADKEHVEPLTDEARLQLLTSNLIAEDLPILNPDDERCGETITTPMYPSGTVGKLLGKSSQTVRLYEKSGFLPPTSIMLVGRKQARERRGYTADQLRVMLDLLPFQNLSDKRGPEYSVFSRELWQRWSAMPDGVVVKSKGSKEPKGRRRRAGA